MRCTEEAISFISALGELEGIFAYPHESLPTTAVLLLSPHPQFGGNMDNNVIAHTARAFADAGCASLRFNYHGVANSGRLVCDEQSDREYWTNMERTRSYEVLLDDVAAAWAALREGISVPSREILVGYSLGAVIAGLSAALNPDADVVAVAPPIARVDLEDFDRFRGQKIFVTGNADFAFDAQKFEAFYESLPQPKTHISFPGQDHFFRGTEARVADAVLRALDLPARVKG